jgi:hypothetical protein
MTDLFFYLYTRFIFIVKFILAIGFLAMSYASYSVHYTISVKVVVFFIMGVVWAVFGMYDFTQRAKNL